jgi:hypothetical protein
MLLPPNVMVDPINPMRFKHFSACSEPELCWRIFEKLKVFAIGRWGLGVG